MSLQLSIPDQHDFEDPTLELDEKRLDSWLQGLPVLNPGESLRQILQALVPLNEQRLEPERRLRLLAVYQAMVDRLYQAAEPRRLRSQPLSRRQRTQIVEDAENVCIAMANGYKIVIREWYEDGAWKKKQPVFARTLLLAAAQLRAALVHAYRYYRPEPDGVFLELNQLYRLARHHGLLDSALEVDGQTLTLAALYHAVCLLTLLDPFSAEEGRVDSWSETLLAYAGGVRIVPGNSWQGVPEGLYFLDLQGGGRPRHCVFMQSPAAGAEPHILDARPALAAMHKALAGAEAGQRSSRTEAAILRGLLPEVEQRDKRRSERRANERWIDVVAGIDTVCQTIAKLRAGSAIQPRSWQVRDASEQGYRLAMESDAANFLQVGELLCVIEDTALDDQSLQLLMVRWLRDDREQGVELGVEKLEGAPNAVTIRIEEEAQAGASQALFLASTAVEGSVARLLAPSHVFEEGRTLLVQVGEREIRVRCTRCVERFPEFDCFEFTAAG